MPWIGQSVESVRMIRALDTRNFPLFLMQLLLEDFIYKVNIMDTVYASLKRF
jgi:hypothetical protein